MSSGDSSKKGERLTADHANQGSRKGEPIYQQCTDSGRTAARSSARRASSECTSRSAARKASRFATAATTPSASNNRRGSWRLSWIGALERAANAASFVATSISKTDKGCPACGPQRGPHSGLDERMCRPRGRIVKESLANFSLSDISAHQRTSPTEVACPQFWQSLRQIRRRLLDGFVIDPSVLHPSLRSLRTRDPRVAGAAR